MFTSKLNILGEISKQKAEALGKNIWKRKLGDMQNSVDKGKVETHPIGPLVQSITLTSKRI